MRAMQILECLMSQLLNPKQICRELLSRRSRKITKVFGNMNLNTPLVTIFEMDNTIAIFVVRTMDY